MDLRSCYFCGTVGDALDTVSLPRDDGDPVRVTLCTGCLAKLDRLLDAVDLGGGEHPADADAPPDGSPPLGTDEGAFRGTGEVRFDHPEGEAERDAGAERERGDGDRPPDGSSAPASGAEGSPHDADVGADVEPSNGAPRDAAAGPGTTESDHGPTGTEDSADDGLPSGGGTETDDGIDDGETDDGIDDGTERGGGLRGLGPDDSGQVATYRKALRLLQNREFPMERAAVVDLLGSAYDLDRTECNRLLDFAVENGILVEDGSELRQP